MKMSEPSEVVAPEGVSASAEPLRLLHLLHERHFELLWEASVPSAPAAAPPAAAAVVDISEPGEEILPDGGERV